MRFTQPTPEQEQGYKDWVASRPTTVRAVAERFEPWSLYRMKSTGHRVTLASFGEREDGGVDLTVNVLGQFNFLSMERQVFGVDPDDLTPCELPEDGEPVGVFLDKNEQIELINARRRENGLPPLEIANG